MLAVDPKSPRLVDRLVQINVRIATAKVTQLDTHFTRGLGCWIFRRHGNRAAYRRIITNRLAAAIQTASGAFDHVHLLDADQALLVLKPARNRDAIDHHGRVEAPDFEAHVVAVAWVDFIHIAHIA